MEKEKIVVYDNHGFHYALEIEHHYKHGYSDAILEGRVVERCTLNKLSEPIDDDDFAWERFHEMLSEWKYEALVNLKPRCKEHFNSQS